MERPQSSIERKDRESFYYLPSEGWAYTLDNMYLPKEDTKLDFSPSTMDNVPQVKPSNIYPDLSSN